MIHSLHIETQHTPIILERIMSTTRVRGYQIRNMEVRTPDADQFGITLTVEGGNGHEKLIHQLEKIYGISRITALHPVDTALHLHAHTGT